MKVTLSVFFILILYGYVHGQNTPEEMLASQFYDQQEFDKSLVLYQKLYTINPIKHYPKLLKNLTAIRKYSDAIQLIQNHYKSNKDYKKHQDLGWVKYLMRDSSAASLSWRESIVLAAPDYQYTYELLDFYRSIKAYDYMSQLIEKAQQAQKNPNLLSDELVSIKLMQGDYAYASKLIMEKLQKPEANFSTFLTLVQNHSQNKEFLSILERNIYGQLSKSPDNMLWNESAIWLSLQNKNYDEAIDLTISLDRRNKESGHRVLSIADIAYDDGYWTDAHKAYKYLVKKNDQPYIYHQAYYKLLRSLYQNLESIEKPDSTQISSLHQEFNLYFSQNIKSNQNATTQLLFSKFQLRYLKQTDSAIQSLKYLIELPGLAKPHYSQAKIDLADYMLVSDQEWEAALLYGQVDKDEKDGPLGELARFKNAKLFYYKGEFELAQELFSILKSATSELLANDALALSVMIQDNLNDDSLAQALKTVAQCELMIIKGNSQAAINLLEKSTLNPAYSDLVDDIWMILGEYYLDKKNFKTAANYFDSIYTKFPRSVLADKALYKAASIREEYLDSKDEAQNLYLNIISKYKDSVYTVNARKRIRALRGENIDG